MLTSDDFRSKMEEAEVFDFVQTEQERFGTTYWYMTLRKYGAICDLGTQRVIQDIPAGFHSPQVCRPPTSVEIVRKPAKLSMTTGAYLPPLSETKSFYRTKQEYISDKSTLLQSDLKKIKPTTQINPDDFVIEGRNKLELEATAFFKANPYKDAFNVPRNLFDASKKENENECIASNLEPREIIKSGLAAFLN